MPGVYLSPYSIRIRKPRSQSYYRFEDVFLKPDVLTVVNNFFLSLKGSFSDHEEQKAILRIVKQSKYSNYINGVVESGEYGRRSSFYNRVSGALIYIRGEDDAETLPFYFLLHIEPKLDAGILIVQRLGNLGISNALIVQMKKYLKNLVGEAVVEIEPVASDNVLQRLVKHGRITKVQLIKHKVSSDIADFFTKGKKQEPLGFLQLNLVANRGTVLRLNDRLNKLIFGSGQIRRLVNIRDFDPDETRVTVKEGNSTRIITLGSNKFRPLYDITDQIQKDSEGHPTFDSVDAAAKDVATDLLKLTSNVQ